MPLVKYWSTSIATCCPLRSASAIFNGASRPAGMSVPIFTARNSSMIRLAEALFGPAKQDGGVQPMGGRRHRRQLPVAEMGRKDQRRLFGEAQLGEQFVRAQRDFDPALFRKRRVVIPDMIEMGKFGAQAPKIVPDTV